MSPEYYSDQDYRRAKKRVKAKKGFYWHLASYIIIIGFLFCINILTDPYDNWYLYPMLSWGVALLFHYIGVFGIPGLNFNDKSWEEKQIQKELQKTSTPRRPTAAPTIPDDELELKEFKELRDEWKDSDFV